MSYILTKRPIKLATLAYTILMGTTLMAGVVHADACTYREAIMALEKGNGVRGLALMRMASRDGDRRAEQYLLEQGSVAELPLIVQTLSPLKTASISDK